MNNPTRIDKDGLPNRGHESTEEWGKGLCNRLSDFAVVEQSRETDSCEKSQEQMEMTTFKDLYLYIMLPQYEDSTAPYR